MFLFRLHYLLGCLTLGNNFITRGKRLALRGSQNIRGLCYTLTALFEFWETLPQISCTSSAWWCRTSRSSHCHVLKTKTMQSNITQYMLVYSVTLDQIMAHKTCESVSHATLHEEPAITPDIPDTSSPVKTTFCSVLSVISRSMSHKWGDWQPLHSKYTNYWVSSNIFGKTTT